MSSKTRSSATLALTPLVDLPPDMLRNIGLVVVKHSNLENLLLRACYLLAGVDDVVGRLALRGPRTRDRLSLIEDLAKHRGVTLNDEALTLLRRDIPIVTNKRDALAHGLFFEHPDTNHIMIRELNGSWQPPGTQRGKVKKRVQPPASPVTTQDIFDIARLISAANQTLKLIIDEIVEQLPAPPKEHPASSPEQGPRQ